MYKVIYFLSDEDLEKGNLKNVIYKARSFADTIKQFMSDKTIPEHNIYMITKMDV